jgi:hypothetical protein
MRRTKMKIRFYLTVDMEGRWDIHDSKKELQFATCIGTILNIYQLEVEVEKPVRPDIKHIKLTNLIPIKAPKKSSNRKK